jgi:hypothetical protein
VTTCTQLITNDNYTGPICLVVGDDLENVDENNYFYDLSRNPYYNYIMFKSC